MRLRTLDLVVGEQDIAWTYRVKISGEDEFEEDRRVETRKLLLDPPSREAIVSLVRLQRCLADTLAVVSLPAEDTVRFEGYLNDVTQFLGERLYCLLFGGFSRESPLAKLLMDAIDQTKSEDLLRVQLEFTGKQEEEFVSWPWEYMFIPEDKVRGFTGEFLAPHAQLVLTRRHYLTNTPLALATDPPVKVLLVCASPRELGAVQYDAVATVLRDLQAAKAIELFELIEPPPKRSEDHKPTATFDRFKELVKEKKPHVIHFIGHGRLHEGQGELAFMKMDFTADYRPDFAIAAKPTNESNELKLVFLQACESGLSDPGKPLSAVAHKCAHRNVPAIVAMQAKIQNETAGKFASQFYKSLAENKTVDFAVLQARHAIKDARQPAAFGVPVLYLRSFGKLINPQRSAKSDSEPTSKPVATGGGGPEQKCPCPRCRKLIGSGAKFCTYCKLCFFCDKTNGGCGYRLLDPVDGTICDECGKSFEQIPWEGAKVHGEPQAETGVSQAYRLAGTGGSGTKPFEVLRGGLGG